MLLLVKAWGRDTDPPVFVGHGITLNAGAMDLLIYQLPTSFYYLCLDLPGHGCSSHFQSFFPANSLDFVMVYKMVLDHFKRKRYIFLAHSYSAQIGLMFAQVYPEYFTKIIAIDVIYFRTLKPEKMIGRMAARFEKLAKIDRTKKKDLPTYSHEEVVEKLLNNSSMWSMGRKVAERIVARGTIEVKPGRYQFTNDPRIVLYEKPPLNVADIVELVRSNPITCPTLIILFRDTMKLHDELAPVVEMYKKTNKKCQVIILEGTHHLCISQPEVVAPTISRFLLESTSKL